MEANVPNEEDEGVEKEEKKQGPAGFSHKKVARQGSWRQVFVSINFIQM